MTATKPTNKKSQKQSSGKSPSKAITTMFTKASRRKIGMAPLPKKQSITACDIRGLLGSKDLWNELDEYINHEIEKRNSYIGIPQTPNPIPMLRVVSCDGGVPNEIVCYNDGDSDSSDESDLESIELDNKVDESDLESIESIEFNKKKVNEYDLESIGFYSFESSDFQATKNDCASKKSMDQPSNSVASACVQKTPLESDIWKEYNEYLHMYKITSLLCQLTPL